MELLAYEAAKLIPKRNPLFARAVHARKDGELDVNGTDMLVFLSNYFAVPFQVKTWVSQKSRRGKIIREHYRKYPHIILLFVRREQDIRKLSVHIENIVLRLIKKRRIPVP